MSEQRGDETYPMQWWITWGLEVVSFHKDCEPEVFHANMVNVFRVPFASKDAAYLFCAELQRFLGDLYLQSTTIPPDRLVKIVQQTIKAMAKDLGQ